MSGRAGAAAGVHATCLVWGTAGILIRGPSGAGKSTLARQLLERGERDGRFAALVADDRVILAEFGGRIVARCPAAIAGLLEIRGIGLVSVPHEPACLLRLVVDLAASADEVSRFPEPDERVSIGGVRLPLLRATIADAADQVPWRLRGMHDTGVTGS